MIPTTGYSIILIDDECLVCNHLAWIISRHDSRDQFRIAGLLSVKGRILLEQFNFKGAVPESVILIENEQLYSESEAIKRIFRKLGPWKWLATF